MTERKMQLPQRDVPDLFPTDSKLLDDRYSVRAQSKSRRGLFEVRRPAFIDGDVVLRVFPEKSCDRQASNPCTYDGHAELCRVRGFG